jgi:hypothetical protein
MIEELNTGCLAATTLRGFSLAGRLKSSGLPLQWNSWSSYFQLGEGGAPKVRPLFISKVRSRFMWAVHQVFSEGRKEAAKCGMG